MMLKPRRKSSRWVVLAWSLNGLGLIALLLVLALYWTRPSTQAAAASFVDPQGTPYPTLTPVPTIDQQEQSYSIHSRRGCQPQSFAVVRLVRMCKLQLGGLTQRNQ